MNLTKTLVIALAMMFTFVVADEQDWEKANALGDHHKHLEVFVGAWDTVMTYTGPDGKATETAGRCIKGLVWGGRFLKQSYSSQFMGQIFEGTGFMGYDNAQKKYVSIWVDNTSTGIYNSTGDCKDGKVFTMSGSHIDPMSGQQVNSVEVTTVDSEDQHTFVMYTVNDKGERKEEFKIVYTRPKDKR